MSDLEHVRTLLEAADRDISALRGMRDTVVFADEIFGFHTQQAVEKLFKAWLALLGEIYPLTHDLDLLLDLLQAQDTSAARFRNLVEYTPFAVQFRYDAIEPDAIPTNRDEALQRLESLRQHVRQQVTEVKGA